MKSSPKCVSDYILIRPETPKGGAFQITDGSYIDERGILEACGPLVPDEIKKLVGKKILFNAWACDIKKIGSDKYYFAPASANTICATI